MTRARYNCPRAGVRGTPSRQAFCTRWAVAIMRQSEACLCQAAGWLACFGRVGLCPWRDGWVGRSVVFGFGSDCSEVPVFRDLPAALDSESPLIVLPDLVALQRPVSARSCR